MKQKEIKSDLDPFMRVNLKEIYSAWNVDTRKLIKSNESEKKIGDSVISMFLNFLCLWVQKVQTNSFA